MERMPDKSLSEQNDDLNWDKQDIYNPNNDFHLDPDKLKDRSRAIDPSEEVH